MKILISKYIGPCFGVNSAITEVFSRKDNIKLLGEIAHNDEIINKISKMRNVKLVHNVSEVDDGDVLITRTHGITLDNFIELKKRNINIIDKTCPHVKFIHNIVEQCANNKSQLIIIGDKNHPEVIGIKSRCKNNIVISDIKDIKFENFDSNVKNVVVSQTTFNLEVYNKVCSYLKLILKNVKFYNTICLDSVNRKNELMKISNRVDLIIVIGSKTSSNSTKLFDVAKKLKNNSIMINNDNELDLNNFGNKEKIFITSGASVMKETVNNIINKLNLI